MGLLITDSTLRDAQQSLIATRMRTSDMLPIAEMMDKVGFFSLDVWGGATFDACIRFLNEDPWQRLRDLKERIRHTRLQMVLRGQSLVGYRHYSDDVVREFIRLAVKNGVDVFRIFDALNDVRNVEFPIKVAKEYGAHVQGSICYTTSPVHRLHDFVGVAEALQQLGCDSISIEDTAGLLSPSAATQIVKAIKRRAGVPLALHAHCSSGVAPMAYHAAALAGVDIVDTALSPFSGGTSLPSTESVVAAFKDTRNDTGLNLELLYQIGEYFAALGDKYGPLFTAEASHPGINVLVHQIPGGMLSNLVSQLQEQNMLERLNDVLEEVPRVRADLGYPPLTAPASQVVVTQAVLNVLYGKRYKRATEELKDYLLGHYGRPPCEVNEDVRKAVVGNERPIEVRPAELRTPELEMLRYAGHKLGIIHGEEDLVTYALFPQVAVKFLRGEAEEEPLPGVAEPPRPAGTLVESPVELNVEVDGEAFTVKVSLPPGRALEVEEPKTPRRLARGAIVSPLRGMVLRLNVKIGDRVKKGGVVAVIEALKMENKVSSSHAGVVREIFVHEGQRVGAGDILVLVE